MQHPIPIKLLQGNYLCICLPLYVTKEKITKFTVVSTPGPKSCPRTLVWPGKSSRELGSQGYIAQRCLCLSWEFNTIYIPLTQYPNWIIPTASEYYAINYELLTSDFVEIEMAFHDCVYWIHWLPKDQNSPVHAPLPPKGVLLGPMVRLTHVLGCFGP